VTKGEIWRSQSTGRALAGPLTLEKITNGPKGMHWGFDLVERIDTMPKQSVRLNLGCSDRLEPGFENVDICQPCDRVVDLRGAWPWETGSVSEIRAWDIIEHLPDRIHTMNEAFRVLKPGGRLDIIVPTTDGRGAFQDPTHVSFWNRNSFFYFEAGNPHLTRFEKAYGMRCAFRIVSEKSETLVDGVTKLHIVLEAVERELYANAAD
jgi:predicted SAM-dependent methyltransferase